MERRVEMATGTNKNNVVFVPPSEWQGDIEATAPSPIYEAQKKAPIKGLSVLLLPFGGWSKLMLLLLFPLRTQQFHHSKLWRNVPHSMQW